ERARAGLRSRARRALGPPRGAGRLRLSMLEVYEPDGAFEALEAYLAEELDEGLVADVYLGYGMAEPLRREPWPSPPEPCRLPLLAAQVRASNRLLQASARAGEGAESASNRLLQAQFR